MVFKDRKTAGKLLARKLTEYRNKDSIILSIPRGGVIAGCEIAEEINIPLDLIIPRKLGAPNNPEYAIGAVTINGEVYLNPQVEVQKEYLEKEVYKQVQEIKRRMEIYRGNKPLPDLKNKYVIIVDDGIATGSTILASVKFIEKEGAKKIVIAVPVLPKDTLNRLLKRVDDVVYLSSPEFFYAVGQFYEDFRQIEDEEVIEILNEGPF